MFIDLVNPYTIYKSLVSKQRALLEPIFRKNTMYDLLEQEYMYVHMYVLGLEHIENNEGNHKLKKIIFEFNRYNLNTDSLIGSLNGHTASEHVYMCIHIYICVRMQVCTCVCTYVCMYVLNEVHKQIYGQQHSIIKCFNKRKRLQQQQQQLARARTKSGCQAMRRRRTKRRQRLKYVHTYMCS